MAVANSGRGNKRRKLSPPGEDVPQQTKRKSKPVKSSNDATNTNDSETNVERQVQPTQMPSVKGLDSSEPAVRRSTLKTILENLQSRSPSAPFSSTQCLQLWRGFFVAIYMHDSRSALSVQNLLREIAGTFGLIASKDKEVEDDKLNSTKSCSVENGSSWLAPYHSAFWETVSREWVGIDSHRMNKYLLLVRFALRELFAICMKDAFELIRSGTGPSHGSKDGASEAGEDLTKPVQSLLKTKACVDVLETVGPLNPSQRTISDGLRLHVLDIWSDEVFGALDDLEDSHKSEKDSANGVEQRKLAITPLLLLLQHSVERVSKSDSGAQRHIRLRAKDAINAMNEQLEERSLNTPE